MAVAVAEAAAEGGRPWLWEEEEEEEGRWWREDGASGGAGAAPPGAEEDIEKNKIEGGGAWLGGG